MDKKNYKEERFDSYLNKIIIYSSKKYFKKQMNIANNEKAIDIENESNNSFYDLITLKNSFSTIDNIDVSIELDTALKSLSAIEQSVIFLLYQENLTHEEAAKILEIWTRSVTRIKMRAIEKLRKYLEGDE